VPRSTVWNYCDAFRSKIREQYAYKLVGVHYELSQSLVASRDHQGLATYFPPVGNTATADIKLLADDNVSEFLVADLQ
jgi:hypothetical protein